MMGGRKWTVDDGRRTVNSMDCAQWKVNSGSGLWTTVGELWTAVGRRTAEGR